ncbi:ABC transporter substrate-binding protein [Fontimonas sp. SYSU GA230001]|uniref:MlaC/ttg2D family ABC transporter substrate-binding protein n=1 Tax=Fontimonas sp. SYSU GA230001 TaxID=3142450 RepID=UPI0032B347A3
MFAAIIRSAVLLWALVLLTPHAAASESTPQTVVQGATDQLLSQIQKNRKAYEQNQADFRAMVDGVLLPVFDFDYTGRLVLAQHWKSASGEQRQRFLDAFRHTLINTYASAFLGYEPSTRLVWKAATVRNDGSSATVNLEVQQPGKPPLAIAFSMRLDGQAGWRIYDIAIEGISLAVNFRGQFAAEIKRGGLDALIARLESSGSDAAPAGSGS